MPSTITIVFRGLLVFNQIENTKQFEVGILNEPAHHVPRILRLKHGVLEETFDLKPEMGQAPVRWLLVADDPVKTEVSLRLGNSFNRTVAGNLEQDFRWIIDLENNEFPYDDIDAKFHLNRTKLPHVITITSGELYTRLQSQPLERVRNNDPAVLFGPIAGVTGCDIEVNTGDVKLLRQGSADPIFLFKNEPDVIYELANSPADTSTDPTDHFPHYYSLFSRQPADKFSFNKHGGGPGPNPALCGAINLSKFSGTLE
jgi:hypothetical protein